MGYGVKIVAFGGEAYVLCGVGYFDVVGERAYGCLGDALSEFFLASAAVYGFSVYVKPFADGQQYVFLRLGNCSVGFGTDVQQ